jgi:hypothetical protein
MGVGDFKWTNFKQYYNPSANDLECITTDHSVKQRHMFMVFWLGLKGERIFPLAKKRSTHCLVCLFHTSAGQEVMWTGRFLLNKQQNQMRPRTNNYLSFTMLFGRKDHLQRLMFSRQNTGNCYMRAVYCEFKIGSSGY